MVCHVNQILFHGTSIQSSISGAAEAGIHKGFVKNNGGSAGKWRGEYEVKSAQIRNC